jgi:hypothetical protein
MTNIEQVDGQVKIDILIKSKDIVDIYMYMDGSVLMYPRLIRPTQEQLDKYTKQECGMDQFEFEYIHQTCDGDACSGTILFPLREGYFLSVEYHS